MVLFYHECVRVRVRVRVPVYNNKIYKKYLVYNK